MKSSDTLPKHCYKCHTDQDLSVKKHDRKGRPVYICRPCRRANYHANKHQGGIIISDEERIGRRYARRSYETI